MGDVRGGKLNEVLEGIKMIKFNAWEKLFQNKLDKIEYAVKKITQKIRSNKFFT